MPAHHQPETPSKREEVGKRKQNPTDTSPELQTALIWLCLNSVTLTSSQGCHPRCHPSTWLSLTSQCLPRSRLGRNWWPDYIDPQNLFTAQGLLKEQLNVRHTKKYFISKWESKEQGGVWHVRSTIEVKPQRPTVPFQHLCSCTFLWKKSHSRLHWNFSCRGSLAVKAKEGRLGFTFYNIPSVCHFTLPCPFHPNKGQTPTEGFIHTDNFWVKFLPEMRFGWVLTTTRATELSQLTFTQEI